MRLLNVRVLDRFARKHPDARPWINAWRATVERAAWSSLQDVRQVYAAADGVKLRGGEVVTVFNVKGNEYRLLTSIVYARRDVYVLDVLTHADYGKDRWKDHL